jgi:hypothetical protein
MCTQQNETSTGAPSWRHAVAICPGISPRHARDANRLASIGDESILPEGMTSSILSCNETRPALDPGVNNMPLGFREIELSNGQRYTSGGGEVTACVELGNVLAVPVHPVPHKPPSPPIAVADDGVRTAICLP